MCYNDKKRIWRLIMSVFTRANWHSGLTYRQTCPGCKTVVVYMDDKLDFRPWFPDGFVYCPTCMKPLRHSENHAINNNTQGSTGCTSGENTTHTAAESDTDTSSYNIAIFCSQCGNKFRENDKFCSQCGHKR